MNYSDVSKEQVPVQDGLIFQTNLYQERLLPGVESKENEGNKESEFATSTTRNSEPCKPETLDLHPIENKSTLRTTILKWGEIRNKWNIPKIFSESGKTLSNSVHDKHNHKNNSEDSFASTSLPRSKTFSDVPEVCETQDRPKISYSAARSDDELDHDQPAKQNRSAISNSSTAFQADQDVSRISHHKQTETYEATPTETSQLSVTACVLKSHVESVEKDLTQVSCCPPTKTELPTIKTNSTEDLSVEAVIIDPIFDEMQKTSQAELLVNERRHSSDYEKGEENPSFHAESSFTNADDRKPSKTKEDEEVTLEIQQKPSLFFEDGVRRIDYVMAYEDDNEDELSTKDSKRQIFEKKLEDEGLKLETESKENSQDKETYFVKIHVPWDICLKYAEGMKMKMPLKEDREDHIDVPSDDHLFTCNWFSEFKNRALKPFRLSSPELQSDFSETNCYTSEFTRDKMDFFDIKDQNTFFSNAERSRIAHRIMSKVSYGGTKTDLGIDKLVLDGVYTAAYPLHEGNFTRKEPKMTYNENMRRLLYWEWARWSRWYKFQPLRLIRKYLGDKVGIYFVWLGFYTQMLIYPAVAGLICLIYSLIAVWFYTPTQEVCNSEVGNLTMCPLCDYDCTYWKLHTSCLALRITYVFDNESTIFFAIFMSLWGTMFLEFWKRRQFRLSYEWDLVDYDEERDLIRPEYEAFVDRKRLNLVTGQKEPFLHPIDRYSRASFSIITVIFWVCLIIAAVFAVIVYRLAINAVFAVTVDPSSLGAIGNVATPSMLTTITASLLSLIVIMVLNKFYEIVALWLTNLELPRTRTDFEDSFTLKMFCFQFVNYYSYLFYIAFFKNSFAGYPGDYNYLFGQWRWNDCDTGGCMYELSLQLVIIMFGKQLWNNVVELLVPWTFNKYRQWKSRKALEENPKNEYTRWEQDYDLSPLKQMDLFYEYLEMVIQYGFVTLFVVAFPLAPLLALLNNIVEIRLDANKFICEYRRPLSQKCSDIGAWYYLLEFIGTLAVVTNAFTIAITSEAIPKLVYYYVYSIDIEGKKTLAGYTNNSLSIFDVADFQNRSRPEDNDPFPGEHITECRYKDYRSPPTADPKYTLTLQYWHVLAARLAFVIVMEHVVFILKRFFDYLVPDRPRKLKEKIKREHFLVQKMMFEAEKEKLAEELSKDAKRQKKPTQQSSAPAVLEHTNERYTTSL